MVNPCRAVLFLQYVERTAVCAGPNAPPAVLEECRDEFAADGIFGFCVGKETYDAGASRIDFIESAIGTRPDLAFAVLQQGRYDSIRQHPRRVAGTVMRDPTGGFIFGKQPVVGS